jgi:hypothetical protein
VKEGEFRHLLSEKLENAKPGYGVYSPKDIISSEYSIVLALLAKPTKGKIATDLPFFSKVTLRLAVMQLESMGFKVFVDAIPLQSAVPTKVAPEKPRRRGRSPSAASPIPAGSSKIKGAP